MQFAKPPIPGAETSQTARCQPIAIREKKRDRRIALSFYCHGRAGLVLLASGVGFELTRPGAAANMK